MSRNFKTGRHAEFQASFAEVITSIGIHSLHRRSRLSAVPLFNHKVLPPTSSGPTTLRAPCPRGRARGGGGGVELSTGLSDGALLCSRCIGVCNLLPRVSQYNVNVSILRLQVEGQWALTLQDLLLLFAEGKTGDLSKNQMTG